MWFGWVHRCGMNGCVGTVRVDVNIWSGCVNRCGVGGWMHICGIDVWMYVWVSGVVCMAVLWWGLCLHCDLSTICLYVAVCMLYVHALYLRAVCIYVFAYVLFIYAHVYVCTSIRMNVYMPFYIDAFSHVYQHSCTYIRRDAHTSFLILLYFSNFNPGATNRAELREQVARQEREIALLKAKVSEVGGEDGEEGESRLEVLEVLRRYLI